MQCKYDEHKNKESFTGRLVPPKPKISYQEN